MTDHVGEFDDGNASLELFDDKSVTEIIDFGSFDAGNAEVAIDGSADVSDQEGIAGFGDKESSVFGPWSFFDVEFDCRLGSFVERNFASVV